MLVGKIRCICLLLVGVETWIPVALLAKDPATAREVEADGSKVGLAHPIQSLIHRRAVVS